ncbi:MAG: tetratricopeptide (TPR) repeat protein [Flavobacterium sp.]|jgi:tetratricopeptide (TPR) repeat protein
MNVTAYISLINEPNIISDAQTLALEKVIDEFPFFQSARALRLKGLYNENSFKYNFALKVTAAHTNDRTVLFDFITSERFIAIQKDLYDKKALELLDIDVIDGEIITIQQKLEPKKNTLVQSIETAIKEITTLDPTTTINPIEEKLAIGAPLDFSAHEKHSFQEWLKLSRIQPIDRANEKNTAPKNEGKKKKNALIDKFIENSPKISPVRHGIAPTIRIDTNRDDHSSLMTETLAKVYLEQKKYQKAIQAYEILILKYPEKSSFFADRITNIKILQQNNN